MKRPKTIGGYASYCPADNNKKENNNFITPEYAKYLINISNNISDYINNNKWTIGDYEILSNITGESKEICERVFTYLSKMNSELEELLINQITQYNITLQFFLKTYMW